MRTYHTKWTLDFLLNVLVDIFIQFHIRNNMFSKLQKGRRKLISFKDNLNQNFTEPFNRDVQIGKTVGDAPNAE